ncbi:50S ribosomal protein L30 [Ornatilinea apprima]|uniref:Large ribosomal subunit protein uL30 n=1 Tax=Ornatilinea apprima TaxID=1134406 RepID=A0A0P6X1C0_9CHLR|nr:50S ribosomal protein L30 [Ornatilinea apprima]KPL76150.1 50S ribosomal protein L30 [Ornatilinea apprima]
MAKKSEPKKLRITLVRSVIGNTEKHKATVRALGLHKINQSVVQEDSATLQGMLRKINHLVKVEEQVE